MNMLVRMSPYYVGPWGSGYPIYYFIGEAPGAEEEKIRQPFVGKSGTLLRQALGLAGFQWKDVRLWNTVAYRPVEQITPQSPPMNRVPTKSEQNMNAQALIGDINAHSPRLLICLGKTAYENICDPIPAKYSQVNGGAMLATARWKMPVAVAFHPAFVLRQDEGRENRPEFKQYVKTMMKVKEYVK